MILHAHAPRPSHELQLKICGVRDRLELEMLEREGIDYAGLWLGVPGGRSAVTAELFLQLAGVGRRTRGVAVATSTDPRWLRCVLASNVAAVQLHGFDLPASVRELRRKLPAHMELFKTLHLQADGCAEDSLLNQYLESGAEAFLLDNFVSRAEMGSTGRRAPRDLLLALVDRIGAHRVIIAGGIQPADMPWLTSLGVRGIDIDTAARTDGKLDRNRVRALRAAASEGECAV